MGGKRKSQTTSPRTIQRVEVDFSAPHSSFVPKKLPAAYSFSQLSLFERCPRKYWIEYVAKIKTPQTRPLILGSAIHHGVEDGLKHLIAAQPTEVDTKKWIESADTQSPPGDCVKDYQKGLQSFSEWLPTLWEDRASEPEIATEWSFGLNRQWHSVGWTGDRLHKPPGIMLRGSIDLMAIHHFEAFAYVWDLKTGRNPYEVFPSPGIPHRQLAVYAWALFCFHPHLDTVATSFFNLMVNGEPEEGAIFDLERAMEYGRNWVEKLVRDIESRDPTKIDEWEPAENRYCGYCSFKEGCPIGKKIQRKKFVPKRWNRKDQAITDEAVKATLERLNDDMVDD